MSVRSRVFAAPADPHPEEIRVLEPRPVPPIVLPVRLGTAVAA